MMRDNTSRKKFAPVVITILVILYMGPLLGGMVLAAMAGLMGTGERGVLPILLTYAIIGGAVLVGILFALAQRLREIDGGEEEDAKKY